MAPRDVAGALDALEKSVNKTEKNLGAVKGGQQRSAYKPDAGAKVCLAFLIGASGVIPPVGGHDRWRVRVQGLALCATPSKHATST